MHLELTYFMMRALMEIFFSSSKLLLKRWFYPIFQFTLTYHCLPPGHHHFILPADFFIKYTYSLIIISCLEKPWQFHKST